MEGTWNAPYAACGPDFENPFSDLHFKGDSRIFTVQPRTRKGLPFLKGTHSDVAIIFLDLLSTYDIDQESSDLIYC